MRLLNIESPLSNNGSIRAVVDELACERELGGVLPAIIPSKRYPYSNFGLLEIASASSTALTTRGVNAGIDVPSIETSLTVESDTPPSPGEMRRSSALRRVSVLSTVTTNGFETHHNQPRYLSSSLFVEGASNPLDVETNMKVMDKLYDASFYSFIRSDENVLIIARHVINIVQDYDLKTTVNATRWIVEGWTLENLSKFLKLVTREWTADSTGLFVHLLSKGWEIDKSVQLFGSSSDTSFPRLDRITFKRSEGAAEEPHSKPARHALLKLVAIMVAGEPANVSAKFVHYLTISDDWTIERVTEMVGFLDAVLEWDDVFFQEFTQTYVEVAYASVVEREKSGDTTDSSETRFHKRRSTGKISFEYLAALYKTNLALANYRLALADFKLAAASKPINGSPEAEVLEDNPSILGEIHTEPLLGEREFDDISSDLLEKPLRSGDTSRHVSAHSSQTFSVTD